MNDIHPQLSDSYSTTMDAARKADGGGIGAMLLGTISGSANKSFKKMTNMFGDPTSLRAGARMILANVKGNIEESETRLKEGIAGVNFRSEWKGSGAQSFFDYKDQQLMPAVQTLKEDAATIADSISDYASALDNLRIELIKIAAETATSVSAEMGNLSSEESGTKEAAKAKVKAKVGGLSSVISGLIAGWGAKEAANVKVKDLIDKAVDLQHIDGLPTVTNDDPRHSVGPDGQQVPMPNLKTAVNPDWSKNQTKKYWQYSGSEFKIDHGPFLGMVKAVRDNGKYWKLADQFLITAWLNHLPKSAFSTLLADSGEFYANLNTVLARRHSTYMYSEPRLQQLGNLLEKVAQSYGAVDTKNAQTIDLTYLSNK
ncbi:WXG100 family type VII secretion target [Stackebrandtia nassauensis]|uniref:Uncharacterized protein n=1 Tax=Stackebrandtia nassauensis (strain DSM 44728 / CIP 108903 / NRRL B-16338 / NBRC 102104 / LLR-40K-21) TaxID=446470 RepID=D3PYU1_STANL|nr:hypothetical protein [Stackebrandtia nassauensis]ADD43524.1 hypothetical protein Snas_3869 [Stackebrandtia nassauensis DSM 44728]